MHCPFCNHGDTQVMETRISDTGDSVRRRRRCAGCERRFTTYERIELSMPSVVKSDGSRMDYDRAKLEFSMRLALRKRPVTNEALESALDHVEGRLFKLGLKEVPSATIGELVMDQLRKLDKVAYIRFASVYRKFEDIEAFADAINEIRPNAKAGSVVKAGPVAKTGSGLKVGPVVKTGSGLKAGPVAKTAPVSARAGNPRKLHDA